MILLHKKNSRTDMNNQRDIHLMPHSIKLYEASVLKACENEIKDSITETNHGFMKGKSCATALEIIHNKMNEIKDG